MPDQRQPSDPERPETNSGDNRPRSRRPRGGRPRADNRQENPNRGESAERPSGPRGGDGEAAQNQSSNLETNQRGSQRSSQGRRPRRGGRPRGQRPSGNQAPAPNDSPSGENTPQQPPQASRSIGDNQASQDSPSRQNRQNRGRGGRGRRPVGSGQADNRSGAREGQQSSDRPRMTDPTAADSPQQRQQSADNRQGRRQRRPNDRRRGGQPRPVGDGASSGEPAREGAASSEANLPTGERRGPEQSRARQGRRGQQPNRGRRNNQQRPPAETTTQEPTDQNPQSIRSGYRQIPSDLRSSGFRSIPARSRKPRRNLSPAYSSPIVTDKGIRARSPNASSQNWWANRWIEAMEQLVEPPRLQRGRSYAQAGQVLSIKEIPNGVETQVQGSRLTPYQVKIQVKPLSDTQWNQVADALSEQAIFTAQLLAGEMPEDIEEAFQNAGISLFPDQAGDLFTDCSCPDWANPCKHVAASHYILADRFDDDPFLLFRMRGRTQDQILDMLRQRRAGDSEDGAYYEEAEEEIIEEPAHPLEEEIPTFWDAADSLDTFPLTISTPRVDMPLLVRLGEPSFMEGETLQDMLRVVYQTITRSALRAAYSEEEPVESNPPEDPLA